MKPLTVLAWVCLAVPPLSVWADPPAVQPGGRAAKDLYAILVVDTDADKDRGDDGIGPSVKKDREHLVAVLENAFRDPDHKMPGRLILKVFDGTRARSETVLGYLQGLQGKVKPSDTILFYYC